MTPEQIARVCHEANTAYCVVVGDPALPHWDALEEQYRQSSIIGAKAALAGASKADLHASWCTERRAQGWTYGPAIDRAAKIHNCLVPYEQLPEAQRTKDALFKAIVDALGAQTSTRAEAY
jgi:hypothetical protein